MDLGKYKKARRAMLRRQGGLRTVVFDPNITDTDVDFPDIERPQEGFAGGGAVKREGFKEAGRAMTVTEKFIEANRAKQAAASEAAKKKFMEAEVTKPTPTSYGGELGVKYADEAQQETVEDLIQKKFSYPKNSVEGRNIDKYLMDEFDLNAASLERITRVIKNKYELKNPKASEFYTGEKKRQRKIDEIRRGRVKELQGARLNIPKETGKEFHHVMPLAGKELITDKGVAAIDKKMNAELSRYNVELNKNAERIKELSTQPDSPARRKEIEKINFSNKNIISKASKELPSQYRGLLGYYEYDTIDLTKPRKKKALNPKKTLGGLEGEELVFKKAKPEQIKSFKQKLSNINKQDAVNAIGSLGCPANYADGGRVNFKQGSSCYAKGLQVLESAKAGDTTALGKVKRFFKTPAGKFLGAVPLELAFEAAFVLPDYAEGKPFDEILGATTFGYFGVGTSPEESIYKYSGNDPKVKEYQETEKLYEQLRKDLETWKAYEENPQRYRNMPQHVLKKSMGELLGRINDNVKLYQQKKHILDPKGEYSQAIEQAKQIQQADYKKNIEESKGRQVVGAGIEKVVGGAKTAYDYITKAYDYMKDKINPDMEGLDVTNEIVDEAALFANGGRVGFKEGGGGFTRRGFLKLLGGIAAIIGAAKAGLKFETKAAKQVLKNAPTGTPEWFAPLVEKIAREGIDVPPELMMRTTGREKITKLEVKAPDSDGAVTDKYYLHENPDTGEIRVEIDSPGLGANDGEFSLYMRPKRVEGLTDEGIQQIDEGEFFVTEDRVVGRATSPDDYDIDLEPFDTDLEGSASNWHKVEEFATGKTDKKAQAKQLQKKERIEAFPHEDLTDRYGDYDPPDPDDY